MHGGAYTVVSVLAQGGFGITYHCFDTRLKCAVATKEFFPLGCARQERHVVPAGGWTRNRFLKGRERFLQEGETLARFQHPGIVGVRAAFEENETAYIVMEFLRGHSLADMLAERGRALDEPVAVDYLERLAAALAVVHEAGMLHRDVKPSNVMVTDDGRVVLIDFGAAREYAWGLSKSHSATLTAGYAPLEQYSRHGLRGPFSDIYGLAATGWHLLTGHPPPAASDRAVGLEMPSLLALRPDIGSKMAQALDHGLAMDPLLRPQTIVEFLDLLRGTQSLVPSGSGGSPRVTSPGDSGARADRPLPDAQPTFAVSPASPDDVEEKAVSPDSPTVESPPPGPVALRAGIHAPLSRKERILAFLVALALLALPGTLALMSSKGRPEPTSAPSPAGSPVQVMVNEKDGSALLAVPGGTYTVGSTQAEMSEACEEARRILPDFERGWLEAESPSHAVQLAPYFIGKREVTNEQFRRFVAATGFKTAGVWEEQARKWGEKAPVVSVTWNDAVAYCDWAGLRLPTEEEWEAAARGPRGNQFPWGNRWDASLCWNSMGTRRNGPAEVGRLPRGASWCGAQDMAGNAWEWTASWYDRYPGSTSKSLAYGDKYRVLRGGSWDNNSPVYFRGATRVRYAPPGRFNDVNGFRCAVTR